MDMTRLGPAPGARALVIGGCGGIGRAYVDGLLAGGARAAVIDRPAALEEAPPPPGVAVFSAEVTDEAAYRAAIAGAAEALGGLDVLAHAVGINPSQTRVDGLDLAEHERVMQVNLRSALVAAQAALPVMDEGGAMVFVSSGLATHPEPSFGSYAMSKAALLAMVKTLAKEAAPGVRVNAVAPGLVETAFLNGGTGAGGTAGGLGYVEGLGEVGERILASIPLRRLATPEDVAAPMLFLTGPAGAYLTGQTLYVGGGRIMP